MYETLLRPHQVDIIPRPPPISVASDALKRLEIRKEEKRLRQIASAHRGKRKRNEEDTENNAASAEHGADNTASVPVPHKRARIDEPDASDAADPQEAFANEAPIAVTQAAASVPPEPSPEPEKLSVSKAFHEVRGHTSYLTFAVLFPPPTTNASEEAEPSDSKPDPSPGSNA